MNISLAFLAPNLVKAAVEGRLPRGIGIERADNFRRSDSIRNSCSPDRRSRITLAQKSEFRVQCRSNFALNQSRRERSFWMQRRSA